MIDPERELLKLLDIERASLVRADFLTINQISARKEELILGLEGAGITTAKLRSIRLALEQNQTLFTAAIAGISAATTRIKTLNDVRSGLRIYDQAGQISKFLGKASGVNKCS